ncbi:MAG: acetyltransferase [Kofleriaceae bacterium]
MSTLWIVGAGGHAKVVIATARAGGITAIRVVDDNPAKHGMTILGITVEGGCESVLADPSARVVLAIGDNHTRLHRATSAACEFATLVHPSAVIEPSVTLGAGTVVFAGAIVQPDSRLGRHVIVNTHASIDHDAVIGDAVHVCPGSHLSGAVTLGEGAFLGAGSTVAPNRTVGAWTVVGAGGVVVHDLPDNVVAVGVPARPR